ncbi:MAG TPA: translation initiation factor IF-2 [Candidatus Acidoferrales bacterium]|nr:translation initiation factor IF-2 [Candidatus Acidoferrales bacterium]
MIRQPIISVMGHVDHGKTTLLDRVRNTAIASREAGGITQHIGASEVPIETVMAICGPLLKATGTKLTIPGLLFIDTPGHEAFTNLRKRGGSVADIAILVVDVTKGFEPQTIEAIEILKGYKTPFIVAANKIDLITGWIATGSKSYLDALSKQSDYVKNEVEGRIYQLVGRLSELGFSSEAFNRIKDFQSELAIVPMSAKTGEGVAELLMVASGLAQKFLEMKLNIEIMGPGRGSILEKVEVKGLGITIDVILYDGTLKVNDTIAFATANAIATAKVKALLKPKPLHQIGESASKYFYVDSVSAASGVKISATGLDDAIPGSPVVQTSDRDYEKEISAEIGEIFKTDKKGLILKADSIGSIEALSKLMERAGYPISRKGIGKVTKRDVIDAFGMNAVDPASSIVMAFGVGVEDDAAEAAFSSGVKILTGSIIYKLLDDYKLFVDERQKSINKRLEDRVIFPGVIEVLPNTVFRASHPAIFGMDVLEGRVRAGYQLINDVGEVVGRVKGIQNDKSPVETAKKGDRFAISVEGPTFGRQIREDQKLYTGISEEDYLHFTKELSSVLTDEEKALLGKIINIRRNARIK